MRSRLLKHRLKVYLSLLVVSVFLTVAYTNCGNPVAFQQQTNASTAQGESFTSQLTVGATGNNPPLDIFFVVDNSASMLGHQINLGNAFSNFFTSNSAALANFNTKIYVFSTASTVNSSYLGQIPTVSPASLSSVPASSSAAANLAVVPGAIFGLWNNPTGQYGVAPFNAQFSPAPVLSMVNGAAAAPLMLAQQGSQSASQYQANITALTQAFQDKLSYLNPTNQTSYQPLTNISSGLCSTARILKHSTNFINPGDSAAFIIVTDDNDRLNDRNSGNQCIDSVVGSNEVVDGTCGHYQTNYSYDSTSTINYQTDTKFNYQSGTQINYTYPTTDSCVIQYNDGYNYTSTYTAIQTAVTYSKCTQTGDGTCLSQSTATQAVAGNYVTTGTTCSQDMGSLVTSPAPGTTYTCSSDNLANQVGPAGVDMASTGTACSSATLTSLQGRANSSNVSCIITGKATVSTTVAGQTVGSCTSFCSANSSKYPGCMLTKATTSTTTASLSYAVDGLTCASQCPNSTQCGAGTIGSYITSLHSNASCTTPSPVISTMVVSAGANSNGSALTCTNSLSGLTVKNSGNTQICSGQSTVASCISSLQSGTANTGCSVSGGDTTNVTSPVDVTCSTSCANSGGFCPATSSTVASYLASKGEYCKSAADSGPKAFSLVFNSSLVGNGSCTTPCSQTSTGSCDGMGWGATNGATVNDYVKYLKGDVCTSSTVKVSDTTSAAVASSSTATYCTMPASPFFFATDTAHPATTVTNFVEGTTTHTASDFQNYIVSQSKLALGANNPPAVAVIGHLTADTSLYGTDPSTDYINLATAMKSTQVSSILGNYATALGQISQFIVKTTQNSFALPIPSTDVVISVAVIHQGSTVSNTMDSSLWSWSGSTLSVSGAAKLVTGDQLVYSYTQP